MLEEFIVQAKSNTYVGGGDQSAAPTRPGSHDLGYREGDWHYIDSYFGGTDFIGQEVVWHLGVPVWAMSYYGRILRPDMIDGTTAGEVIQRSLSTLYQEGRFLGGFTHPVDDLTMSTPMLETLTPLPVSNGFTADMSRHTDLTITAGS